jgi:Na+/proline symporter
MLFTGYWCLVECRTLFQRLAILDTNINFYFSTNLRSFLWRTAPLAGIISAIGYVGFTSSQVLAGAKLASATVDGLDIQTALIVMGTSGSLYYNRGLKAVIYTDTIQWLLLIGGLVSSEYRSLITL